MAIATDGNHDPAVQWRQSYQRVRALATDASEESLAVHVPACPAWSARDLLAHVVGLDHDVLAGKEPDDHDEAWTQGHVDERASWTTAEVLAQWDADAEALETYLREEDPRPLNDMVIHEHDLRGALGSPGGRDAGGVALVRETLAGRLAGSLPDDLAPLRLEATDEDWSWTSGGGEPGAVLRAPGFELFRAVTSRRTAEQLRSWVVAGDVEPYLEHLAQLGPLPTEPLRE